MTVGRRQASGFRCVPLDPARTGRHSDASMAKKARH
jgi:hypothetical protein